MPRSSLAKRAANLEARANTAPDQAALMRVLDRQGGPDKIITEVVVAMRRKVNDDNTKNAMVEVRAAKLMFDVTMRCLGWAVSEERGPLVNLTLVASEQQTLPPKRKPKAIEGPLLDMER